MPEVYTFTAGPTPLLISVPHDGRNIPADIAGHMTSAGLDIPDTDWHVALLYRFAADIEAAMLVANYSRYVVDLNRPASDQELYPGQVATGVCPTQTFAGEPIYTETADLDAAGKLRRLAAYWQPYHERLRSALAAIKERHGYALLWDAHSIPSVVPRLFDGELPVLNIGTFDHQSCSAEIAADIFDVANQSGFESVLNGRFKGGYITRHYGDPGKQVFAVQLEIAQRAYMNEVSREFDEARADRLRATLLSMLESFLQSAKRRAG